MSANSEKGSSKADTLIKVVLVFFISLLSFSVGTFVGHQFSKSEQRRMALEGEYKAERSVASTNESEDEKITDKEVESLTEEFVNKEKAPAHEQVAANEEKQEEPQVEHKTAEAEGYKTYPRATKPNPEPHAAAAATPAATPAPASTAHEPLAKTAEKVAHGEAPTDGMKESRKPASTLPAVASSAVGKYTVQVASYADETEAKNHAATLKGKGWSAFYVPATVQGRTWYRVSVGIYDTNKAAADARSQFMKDTNSKSALVQKIVQ